MPKRLYSLYQRDGKRWRRVSSAEAKLESARRIFQDLLLASVFGGWPELRLRPIKGEDEPIGQLRKD